MQLMPNKWGFAPFGRRYIRCTYRKKSWLLIHFNTCNVPFLFFLSSWYYCLHIVCILVPLTMPARARKKRSTEKESIAPPMEKTYNEEPISELNSHVTTNNNSSQREETAWRRPSAHQWLPRDFLYVFKIQFLEPPIDLWIVHRRRRYYETFCEDNTARKSQQPHNAMPCGPSLTIFPLFYNGHSGLVTYALRTMLHVYSFNERMTSPGIAGVIQFGHNIKIQKNLSEPFCLNPSLYWMKSLTCCKHK